MMEEAGKLQRETDQDLKTYYKTSHWKGLSKSLLAPFTTTCELCGCAHWKKNRKGNIKMNRLFVCHHKNYFHLGHEKRDDIMILCAACHKLAHELLRRNSENSPWLKALQDETKKYFFYEKR